MNLTMGPEAGPETQVATSTESFLETTRGTMNGRIYQDQQGLADLRDGDPRRDPGNSRVEDGHGDDAVRSKIGGRTRRFSRGYELLGERSNTGIPAAV